MRSDEQLVERVAWAINNALLAYVPFDELEDAARAAIEASGITALREALTNIARYDVGHQALVEAGDATPEKLASYYASQVERRRKIARTALATDEGEEG
jgi:hypothetical protein